MSNHVDPIHTEDKYHIFVPIEDDELMKSVTIDENGDYIVQGVMTSDVSDEEDDSISPEGMDCSYFLEKGWIKYEHGNKPEQFIGEPLEVKVGQFEHPKTLKSVNGIFIKGRLFQTRELAQQAIRTITDLQKSQTKRCMGWSIEGNVQERNKKTGKISKSILRNVVLTMNPVNTTTWAELAKSFERNHELTVDMEDPLDKALTLDSSREIRRQSIEGARNKYSAEDPQQKWLNSFRKYVDKVLKKKSFRMNLIKSKTFTQADAYAFALNEGYTADEAHGFASYIADKHTVLKSLGEKIGGARMGNETKNTLASLLDEDLEELQKSLDFDNEGDDDELEKSIDNDEEDENENEDEGDEGDEDDDEDVEKSLTRTDFAKSFGEQNDNAQALEVSDFLSNLVDEIGFHMDGFEKSLGANRKQTVAVVNAVSTMAELVKSLTEEVQSVKEQHAELQKSFDQVASLPVGRRSVVNNREIQTLNKSMGAGGAGQPLSRMQIGNILMKSFEAGEITGSQITRFEAGVTPDRLDIPVTLKQQLGYA